MADFSHLSQKARDTADYVFYAVNGEPILVVKFAGESNKPYFNEVLRRADHYRQRKTKVNVEVLRDNRDRDRSLYPKHVVTGWKNVVDRDGKPVTFTQTDCEAFLRALPDDEFDGLREFCRDAANFRDVADGGAIAGNSQTA